MHLEEEPEGLSAEGPERRIMPRCAVDEEATLTLVNHGLLTRCRVVEVSLEGCRLIATTRLPAGVLVRVETTFKVCGVSFRFSGMGKWTDGQSLIGIRFVDMPTRHRNELAAVLCELEAENAAKAEILAVETRATEEEAAEEPAIEKAGAEKVAAGPVTAEERAREMAPRKTAEQTREQAGEWTEAVATAELSRAEPRQARSEPAIKPPATAVRPPAPVAVKPGKRDRRVQSRHEVDTSAMVLLVNVGSWLPGRILDLSLSGCRIRTDERFPVGIYTRVEAEFRLEGLPFRLGGVIQAIHDRNTVGIRCLDVSERKLAQVAQLIDEIEEMSVRQTLAKPENSG